MLHEACDIVEDAGGWSCRTCRAHWRTSVQPSSCAEERGGKPSADLSDRAAIGLVTALLVTSVACLVIAAARSVGDVAP